MMSSTKLFAVTVVISAMLGQKQAAAKAPFEDFAGVYKGTLVFATSTAKGKGPARIVVTTTPDGGSANLSVTASFNYNGVVYQIKDTLRLLAFGVFTVKDVTYNLETTDSPALGTRAGQRVIRYNAPFNYGTPGSFSGTVQFRTAGPRKNLLKLVSVASTDAPVYSFTFQVARPVRSR